MPVARALYRIIDSGANREGEWLVPAGLSLQVWRRLHARWHAFHLKNRGVVGTSINPRDGKLDVQVVRDGRSGAEEVYALLHIAATPVGEWAAAEIERGRLQCASISFLPVKTMKCGDYRVYTAAALHVISVGNRAAHPRATLVDVEYGLPRVPRKFFTGGR
jgi:hypothetical protein